jgi:cytochrome c-type biogenesis protein
VLDDLFTWLTMAMSADFSIAFIAAIGWGVISILLSPCHLSSIPLVIGYISSEQGSGRKRPYLLSLVFAAGILVSIGVIGAVTASAGRMMGDVGVWGNVLVAGVFFLVGLYLLDVINPSWQGLVPHAPRLRGWRGALILGLIFGIGLGPCTFAFMAPVLGVAFSLATTSILQAVLLVAAFGIGHCGVIVGAGGAVGTVQKYLDWTEHSKGTVYMRRGAGVLVILAGVYFLFTAF